MGVKGFVADIIILLITLFGIGVGVLILHNIFITVNSELLTALDSSDAQAAVTASNDIWTAVGTGFIILLAFNFVALILSSFFIDTHPAFFVVFLVVAIFTLLIAPIISNAYESIATSPDFAPTANQLGGMNWIMLNLPLIVLAQFVVTGIVLFAKRYAARSGY